MAAVMGGRNGGEEGKGGRADARNRQFGEIERDPEILLLFQSGIRNLAEWDRATAGERERRPWGRPSAVVVVFVCGGHCDG